MPRINRSRLIPDLSLKRTTTSASEARAASFSFVNTGETLEDAMSVDDSASRNLANLLESRDPDHRENIDETSIATSVELANRALAYFLRKAEVIPRREVSIA